MFPFQLMSQLNSPQNMLSPNPTAFFIADKSRTNEQELDNILKFSQANARSIILDKSPVVTKDLVVPLEYKEFTYKSNYNPESQTYIQTPIKQTGNALNMIYLESEKKDIPTNNRITDTANFESIARLNSRDQHANPFDQSREPAWKQYELKENEIQYKQGADVVKNTTENKKANENANDFEELLINGIKEERNTKNESEVFQKQITGLRANKRSKNKEAFRKVRKEQPESVGDANEQDNENKVYEEEKQIEKEMNIEKEKEKARLKLLEQEEEKQVFVKQTPRVDIATLEASSNVAKTHKRHSLIKMLIRSLIFLLLIILAYQLTEGMLEPEIDYYN